MAAMHSIEPYLSEHLIKGPDNYQVVRAILEKSEIVTLFDRIDRDEDDVGSNGFVLPRAHRIPFQQMLLEYLGEVPFFYELHDNKPQIEMMLQLLDEQVTEMLSLCTARKDLLVQFPDNLDGMMTNPNLFKEYCLPHYQKYAEILHSQHKKMCSHTDGNLKPIIDLLPESGLDVCEALSPFPLSECSFEEAWEAWDGGPIIWGGIPSPILEADTGEQNFKTHVKNFLDLIGSKPIIIGIGDQVMPDSLIERVQYIAREVENHAI
jgi:uroporphyrinogen-III decarboxylase